MLDTFVVNKKSWHYKFLEEFHTRPYPTNFCDYWRKIFFGLFFLFVSVAFVLFLIVGSLISIYKSPQESLSFIFILSSVLFAVYGVPMLLKKLGRKEKLFSPETSLLAAKYRSWKGKICPAIEYKD